MPQRHKTTWRTIGEDGMVKVKKSGRLANLIALGTALALLPGMAWVVRGRRVVDSATASSRSASIPVKIFEIKHSDDQQVR